MLKLFSIICEKNLALLAPNKEGKRNFYVSQWYHQMSRRPPENNVLSRPLLEKGKLELYDSSSILTFMCFQQKRRNDINIFWNSALPVIFSVKKYASELDKICDKRNLITNFRHNLIEVIPDERIAIFEHLDTKTKKSFEVRKLIHFNSINPSIISFFSV